MDDSLVQQLNWDTAILGIPCARILPAQLTQSALQSLLVELKAAGIALVYWASDNEDEDSQTAANACEGVLADEKITYMKKLPGQFSVHHVVPYQGDVDNPDLLALAYAVGRESRFYQDPNLPRDAYEKVYGAWMNNSIKGDIADSVFVITDDDKIAGMVTVGIKNNRGDVGLLAVAEGYRGEGLGQKLMAQACHYFTEKGLGVAQVVTQRSNTAACALYERCGFALEKTEYFYHFWLNN